MKTSAVLLPVLLVGAASAQLPLVLPVSADGAEAPGDARGPFDLPSFRWQQIWEGNALAGQAAQITDFSWRRDNGPRRPGATYPARTYGSVTIRLGTTPTTPQNMGLLFGANFVAPPTVVYQGGLSLPTLPPATPGQAAPFDIRIALPQPFVFLPGQGNLILDMTGDQGSSTDFYSLDAAAAVGIADAAFRPIGNTGTFASGEGVALLPRSRFVETDPVGPTGPLLSLEAEGLLSPYPAVLLLGASQQSLDLTAFGAPTNSLYLTPVASVPMQTLPSRRLNAWLARFETNLPNTPAIAGAVGLAQTAFLDPTSNALGIVTTNGLEVRLGFRFGPLTQSVLDQSSSSVQGFYAVGLGPGGPVTSFGGLFQ